MSDKKGRIWMSTKIFYKRFFLEVLDYQDSDAPNKVNDFSPQYYSTGFFKTEFMMEQFEFEVAEEYKFVNGAN